MDELWIVGFLGGGAGAALGLPYAVARRDQRDQPHDGERLLGLWLVLIGVGMAMIGAEHGGLISGPAARVWGHISRLMNLASWPLLAIAAAQIARQPRTKFDRREVYFVPCAIYLVAVGLTGGRSIWFAWVLPASIYGAARIAWVWFRARKDAELPTAAYRLLAGLAVLALSIAIAQTIRTFAPRLFLFREVVPAVATIGFLWLTTAIRSGLFADRSLGQTTETQATRYAKSGLSAQSAATLLARLDKYMKDEELYRDPSLDLQGLAQRLSETTHSVSQALNQHGGRSLNAYLADWRVRHAKLLLEDSANRCFTVEAIGTRSGFASRSAFYRAFREHVGLTPAAYAASVDAGETTASME